jgi:prophage regulatory protein
MSLEHGRPTDDDNHGGRPDRLLPLPEIERIVPYTRQHVARMEKAGRFPQRVQLGPNRVAWWESEVLAWAHGRPRGLLAVRHPEAA